MRTGIVSIPIKTKFIFLALLLISPIIEAQNENSNRGENGGGPQHTTVKVDGVLNFGSFIPGTATGEIFIDFNGNHNPAPTGGIRILPFGQAPSAVTFTVGTLDNGKNIIVTSAPATLTGPGSTLELNPVFDPPTFVARKTPTTVNMGGNLTIEPTDAPGAYTGLIFVTFAYQ